MPDLWRKNNLALCADGFLAGSKSPSPGAFFTTPSAPSKNYLGECDA